MYKFFSVLFYAKGYSENDRSYSQLLHETKNNKACTPLVQNGVKSRKSPNPQPEDGSVLEMRVQQVLSILSLSFNIKQ